MEAMHRRSVQVSTHRRSVGVTYNIENFMNSRYKTYFRTEQAWMGDGGLPSGTGGACQITPITYFGFIVI